jgi:hypothetical protein
MSLSDLELQYNQASAVLPIIQRTYSNIALNFLIPLQSIRPPVILLDGIEIWKLVRM